jgi:two-component system response regulator FixJ
MMHNGDPTVFVVDDDAGVRDSLQALLEAAGRRVETFASAKVFLETFDPARRGCLLLDVRMPGMSGMELQAKLADASFVLPVIIMTGHGDVAMAVEAMKCGAVDFLEKPFKEAALLEAILRAMERGRQAWEHEALAAQRLNQLALLTAREREVFSRLVEGKANKVIADELGISPRTVEIHRARVMDKLGVRTLPDLVRVALSDKLLEEHAP